MPSPQMAPTKLIIGKPASIFLRMSPVILIHKNTIVARTLTSICANLPALAAVPLAPIGASR